MNHLILWNKQVQVFVDPIIRQSDSELYTSIIKKLEQLKFTITTDIDEINHGQYIKKIFIFHQSRRQSDPLVLQNKENIFIEFETANMSLFGLESSEQLLELHLVFQSENEFDNALKLTRNLLNNEYIKRENELFSNSESFIKKKIQNKKLKENTLNTKQIEITSKIEQTLFEVTSFSQLEEKIDIINKTYGFSISLKHAYEVVNEEELIVFQFEKQLYFLDFENSIEISLMPYIYNSLFSVIKRLEAIKTNHIILKDLEQIFSQISIPLAIFDKDQHLVLHNELFIKLNLSTKKCFSFKANEQITIEHNVYKVHRIYVNKGEHIHLNFIPVNAVLGSSSTPSSEELGIVSSSIAHELNNPLAGILAALTVLEMDDYSDEIMEKFSQMRKSVSRCKKLVETFLGFSKVQGGSLHPNLNLEESFNQAMELIRFRLIENNITIQFSYDVNTPMNPAVNCHVMSMIFYLILGELLTNFSHQNLVELKNSQKIEGQAQENSDHFVLLLPKNITLNDTFYSSKLITHLLESQKMTLEVDKNKCVLFL